MPKHHTYVATCIKEAPLQWGIELEALENPVPSKIVRFPSLTQPLTKTPYFQSDCDPIAYFKQLVKGMPEMLRDYHARTLRQIQGQMDQLEVGDCCHVKVSYIDSRGGVSPYKYNIELIDTPPCESHHDCSDTADSGNVGLPSAAPSIDNLYPPFMEEIGSDWGESSDLPDNEQLNSPINNDTDPLELVTQLHEEIQELQGDLDRIKDRIAEAVVPACQSLGQQVVTGSEQATEETPEIEEIGEVDSGLPVAANDQRKEILLNLDEQCAIEYMINQQVVTESQLRDVCHVSNPIRVMNRLIEKMEQCNFPWISTEESQNGELIYMWSAPE
jgi:hypothetical protein